MATPVGEGFTGSEVATSNGGPSWIYSDLGFAFKPNPYFIQQGISGDVVRIYDATSIKQSIYNIVLTNRYERPFKPNFGCNLREFLFEPLGAWDKFEMESVIKDQLALWEPRITVLNVFIEEDISYATVNALIEYEITPIYGETMTDSTQIKIVTERVR
jgi:phage baseplate assembly protein W